MTRLGTAIALAYGLAAIVVFLSVVAMWPTSSVPSLSVAKPSTSPTSRTTAPTERPTEEPTRPNVPTGKPTTPPTPTERPDAPPTPKPTKAPTDPPILAIQGEATFYCLLPLSPCTTGFSETGLYAAAGAELRAALGDWRGQKVTVWRGTRHVTVTLVDTCSCDIDLYAVAFLKLAPLSLGVLDVEIRW